MKRNGASQKEIAVVIGTHVDGVPRIPPSHLTTHLTTTIDQ
jgi:hypothetical protein